VLTASSADLQVKLAGDFVQLSLVGGEFGNFDVNRGTNSCTEIGGTEGEETESVAVRERNTLFDIVDGCHQSAVNLSQVASHLHGNDAKVIFFVAPNQEGLGVVVENATAGGPEAASVGSLQEAIALLEQEVIVDQLLLDLFAHASQRVESTLELSLETGESRGDLLFHLLVLFLGQARVEGVAFQGATAADASRHDVLSSRVQVAEHAGVTPVLGGMFVGLLESTVVVFDDGVEQVGEDGVGFGIGSVDTDSGIMIFQTCNSLSVRFHRQSDQLTRLDHVEESGTERSFLGLQVVEQLSGQVFFQEGFRIGSFQFLETGFQFFQNGGVNHGGFSITFRQVTDDARDRS
jgi:hypothetical protein